MLRSMYSGISGMKVNQTKLDVIGNNIANVGTTAFKSSRTTFTDMLSQSQASAMSPSLNKGGTNSQQIGMGVQLASIDRVMTQGTMQPTNRALDVGIDGDGFFMVSSGPVLTGDNTLEVDHRVGSHTMTSQSLANSGSQIMYTRDGAFTLDSEGNLLTSNGYRVLGYSLTNDDSSQTATAQKPNSLNTTGLDFIFGPGSQLNDYKVVLGSVGPGTVTSADIDKAEKKIVLHGDFSTPGALTSTQVESAINKALSAAGISQQVSVKGNPSTISNLGSQNIAGGSDAEAPGTVSVMGVNFKFGPGESLNDYTIQVGKVSEPKTKVDIDKDNKVITVHANFLESGAVTGEELGDAISLALRQIGIKQEVYGSGLPSQVGGLKVSTNEDGKVAAAPGTIGSVDVTDKPYITFSLTDAAKSEKGAQLNGYSFVFKEDNGTSTPSAKVDKSEKKIIVTVGTKDGVKEGYDKVNNNTKLINDALDDAGFEHVKVNDFRIPNETKTTSNISGGIDISRPKDITIAGLTVKLPYGSKFNNAQIEIANVDYDPDNDMVELKTDAKGNVTKVILRGDFRNQNVTAEELETAINRAIAKSNIYGTTDESKLEDNQKVIVGGSPKSLPGLNSSAIIGGQEYKSPGNQSVFGLDFKFSDGGSLNGYKINIGQVNEGTKTSVKINEKEKSITINGNFVNQGAVTTSAIQSALNMALVEAGIEQTIWVSGTPATLNNTESDRTTGGTPVQSIDTDGTVNFIDGTQDLKSYDGALKTLKIPDKVKIPGSDTELRVKSYNIDSTGVITGVLEDGRVAALGQIAMASFKNPEGLESLGGNLYGGSANSGDPVIKSGVGTLQDDNSGGYGDNLQGMLEMSNVDLAEQFTEMIVTTKAFQASGKMITTGDEILQDIINLKR